MCCISPGNVQPHDRVEVPFLLLFWIVNVLISSNLLSYIKGGSSLNRSVAIMYIGHCYMLQSRHIIKWFFLSLMTLRDVIFQSLMGWSSGSMALHLYKHHKHVLYLHSSRFANNSPPEIRATWSILILMACFLFFYWVDFILSFYTGFSVTHDDIDIDLIMYKLTQTCKKPRKNKECGKACVDHLFFLEKSPCCRVTL